MKTNNTRVRRTMVEVKGELLEYDEYYLIDENGEEIFERNLEIENDIRLFNIYKEKKHLLTTTEIKKIRDKYGLSQKEYALILGFGEVMIQRFEKGMIQSDAVDLMMRLSSDADNMLLLLSQNRKNISDEVYTKLFKRIEKLQQRKRHAVCDFTRIKEKGYDIKEEKAIDIASNIIKIYNDKQNQLVKYYGVVPEYITNLKLQKLLYYVQAICLIISGKKAFPEKILAWSYGPVVKEVWKKYKDHQAGILLENDSVKEISKGLHDIIEIVVSSYGSMEATTLIDFTHEEDPWKKTKLNEEITLSAIKKYFDQVYDEKKLNESLNEDSL